MVTSLTKIKYQQSIGKGVLRRKQVEMRMRKKEKILMDAGIKLEFIH